LPPPPYPRRKFQVKNSAGIKPKRVIITEGLTIMKGTNTGGTKDMNAENSVGLIAMTDLSAGNIACIMKDMPTGVITAMIIITGNNLCRYQL
jgi:hypothetical protein